MGCAQSSIEEPQHPASPKQKYVVQTDALKEPESEFDQLSPTTRERQLKAGGKGKHKRNVSTYDLVKGFDPKTGAKTLNQYVRVAKIGEGSYGKVSLFRNFHDGRYYAIKVLNRELLQRKRVGPGVTALEDVMREERILKRLHNDNIVRIVETINDPGSPKMYIIMDYLAGGTILTPPKVAAVPMDPSKVEAGPQQLAPSALAKIRSMTHIPHDPQSATVTPGPNTPRHRNSTPPPSTSKANPPLNPQHKAPSIPAKLSAHATTTANGPPTVLSSHRSVQRKSPHHQVTQSMDDVMSPGMQQEASLYHHGGSRRLHKATGSSHNLPNPEASQDESLPLPKHHGATASGDFSAPSTSEQPIRPQHHRVSSRMSSKEPSTMSAANEHAFTLNFGGVSLASDLGVASQRMVEPEISEDGFLLPPFGPLPEDVIRKRLRDVLAGLSYLHSQGVAHGDIKPQNLLMTMEGVVKLTDLSCSVQFDPKDPRGAFTTRAPGTPLFTAPECCSSEPFDARGADVWSVGVTAYSMAYGCVPFFAASPFEIYEEICNSPVIWPMYPNVSAGLQSLIASMLEKDPANRSTALQASQHPWLNDNAPSTAPTMLLGALPDHSTNNGTQHEADPEARHVRHSTRPAHVQVLERVSERNFELSGILGGELTPAGISPKIDGHAVHRTHDFKGDSPAIVEEPASTSG